MRTAGNRDESSIPAGLATRAIGTMREDLVTHRSQLGAMLRQCPLALSPTAPAHYGHARAC